MKRLMAAASAWFARNILAEDPAPTPSFFDIKDGLTDEQFFLLAVEGHKNRVSA